MPQVDLSGLLDDWDTDFDDARWVTLAEAAEATGVSRSALRAWFRNDEVPSRIEDGPHGPQRLVPLDAVVDRAREAGARVGRSRQVVSGATDADLVSRVIAALTDQLAEAKVELLMLRRRLEELEGNA